MRYGSALESRVRRCSRVPVTRVFEAPGRTGSGHTTHTSMRLDWYLKSWTVINSTVEDESRPACSCPGRFQDSKAAGRSDQWVGRGCLRDGACDEWRIDRHAEEGLACHSDREIVELGGDDR